MQDDTYSDDLSDLERRLGNWKPGVERLDANAMLYAAGRASVAPGKIRFMWPAVTGLLAALVIVLSVQLSTEHAERMALLNRPSQAPASVAPADLQAITTRSADSLAVNEPLGSASLFAARRAMEKDTDAWQGPEPPASSEAAFSGPAVLQAWQSERVFEP